MVASNPSSISSASRPGLDHRPSIVTIVTFFGLLALGLTFGAYSLYADVADNGDTPQTWLPFLLLGIALLIALSFEFVNGFQWCGCIRYYFAVAGGIDSSGGFQCRFCNDICTSHCRHFVESGYLVAGVAGLFIAYLDWIHHRCRYRQCADARS